MGGSGEAPVCVASTLSRGHVANFRIARCCHRVTADPLIGPCTTAYDVDLITSPASRTPLRHGALSKIELPYDLQAIGATGFVLRLRFDLTRFRAPALRTRCLRVR